MVDLKNLPCEFGNPGELPNPTTELDGGSIDVPNDDGNPIITDRFRRIVPPGNGGGNGGGGEIDPGGGTGTGGGVPTGPRTGAPTPSGVPTGPSTGAPFFSGTSSVGTGSGTPSGPSTGGGTGGSSVPPGVRTGNDTFFSGLTSSSTSSTSGAGGGTTSTTGDGPATGGWVCLPATDTSPGGCAFVANPPPGATVFNSLTDCQANCTEGTLETTDPTSLEDYQFGPGESTDPAVDETYYPIATESYNVNYIESNILTNILAKQRDKRINDLITESFIQLEQINDAYYALSQEIIQKSLDSTISAVIYNLVYPDGRLIPNSKITKGILAHIANGTLSSLQKDYLVYLSDRAINQAVPSRSQLSLLQKSQFGVSKRSLNRNRQIVANTTILPAVNVVPDANRAVNRALSNLQSLDYRQYNDLSKELLKLWYILPTDIYRRINVQTSSGSEANIYINNNDSIEVTTSSGSTYDVSVTPYTYELTVPLSGTGYTVLSSTSDLDRAYSIPNVVEQACLFDAGSEYSTFLQVSSPPSLELELTYDLSAQRQAFFILQLQPSSIEDLIDDDSILCRKTQARYVPITATSSIRNLVEFNLYPWKVFPIDNNDPILGHFTSSSIYTFTFNNFTLEQFGESDGEQILVRKIPKAIVILPTDKFNYNIYNGYSQLVDWNIRSINFIPSPDLTYSNTGLDKHWVKIDDVYPNEDIFGDTNIYAQKGTYVARSGLLNSGFRTGSEVLPRRRHGFRAAVEIARELYQNYDVDEGLMWADIFTRMTQQEYLSFRLGIPNRMIDKLRLGEKTGVKIFHSRVDQYHKESRLLNLKSSGSEVRQILFKVPQIING